MNPNFYVRTKKSTYAQRCLNAVYETIDRIFGYLFKIAV